MVTNICALRLDRSTRFAGGKAFGSLKVPDVADDGVDLFRCDVWDGWHVAEVPMMGDDAFVYCVVEREIGVVSDLV